MDVDAWLNSLASRAAASYDPALREWFVAVLPTALHHAHDAAALRAAVDAPPGAGTALSAWNHSVRLPDASLADADAPQAILTLDPPFDARRLAALWQVARPIAVSGDVEQRRWELRTGGAEFDAPGGLAQIEAHGLRFGRWKLRALLSGRPAGDLPGLHAGPAPAYEIGERGGEIVEIAIQPADPGR